MSAIAFPVTSQPRLRITARGRAVLAVLVALPLAALAIFLGFGSGGAVATQDGATATFEYVTVEPGQSLWDIAADVAPAADPREFAAQVVALNQLASSDLQPGQELAIPAVYVS